MREILCGVNVVLGDYGWRVRLGAPPLQQNRGAGCEWALLLLTRYVSSPERSSRELLMLIVRPLPRLLVLINADGSRASASSRCSPPQSLATLNVSEQLSVHAKKP